MVSRTNRSVHYKEKQNVSNTLPIQLSVTCSIGWSKRERKHIFSKIGPDSETKEHRSLQSETCSEHLPPSHPPPCFSLVTTFKDCLKGPGNEAEFPRFLHKSVRHRSLILHFEPFRFWLRIGGDIHNRKTTRRLGDLASRGVADSPTWRVGESLAFRLGEPLTHRRRVGESAIECLKENFPLQ
jgi:hypothetical protein